MDNPEDLESVYRAAWYELDLPSAVRFRIGDQLDQLTGASFALITAFNPGSSRPSQQENEAANERLRSTLDQQGLRYALGRGMSSDGTHVEPSFAVFDIARDDALRLAAEFRQAAIVWFDGHQVDLAWTGAAPLASDT